MNQNQFISTLMFLLIIVSFLVVHISSKKTGPAQQQQQILDTPSPEHPPKEHQDGSHNNNINTDDDDHVDQEYDMTYYSTMIHIFDNFKPEELEYEIQYLDQYGHLSPRGFLYLFHSRIRGETHHTTFDNMDSSISSTMDENVLLYTESKYLDWDISEDRDMAYICQHWNGLICHDRSDNGLNDTCWCVNDDELREYEWSEDSDSRNSTCIDQCAGDSLGRIHAKNQAPKDAITVLTMYLWHLVGDMIPRDVKSLRFLEEINLHGNYLVGSIPDTIGDLEGLKILRLSGCSVFELPSELQNLKKLECLELNSCRLSGSPDFLENLSSLQVLSMSNNPDILWNKVPSFLTDSLIHLEYLDLSEMDLSGSMPSHLAKMTNLIELDLERNSITGTLPSEISTMPNLQVLKLNGNDLSGTLPTDWTLAIKHIEIASNLLTGPIPSNMFQPHLTDLILYKNKLTGTIPMEVENSNDLARLELDHNLLEGDFPLSPDDFPGMADFEIHANLLTGELDESWCDAIDWSDRTMYPFEYTNVSCTHFIACPKGFVSKLGYATDLDSCVRCPSCNTDQEMNDIYCNSIGQPTSRCADAEIIHTSIKDVDQLLLQPFVDLSSREQREILRKIFVKMHGHAWEMDFHVWGDLRHENPCTLPGIECTNDRVTMITLESANICSYFSDGPCEVPEEIALLGNSLEVLKLDAASFVEHRLILPPAIKHLRKLKELVLTNVRLDDLPKELIECKNLHYLDLKHIEVKHGLQNAIIWNLTWLQRLNIESSDLTNQHLPSKIGTMTEMTHLKIASSNMPGTIPSELGNLSNLKELELYSNSLIGNIPETLSQLQKLTRLDLYNNKLDGSVDIVTTLTSLEILNLNGNRFMGTIPDEIIELKKLFWVDMGHNHLHGAIPSNFAKLPALTHLRLGGNQLAPLIHEDICKLHINDGPVVNGACDHVFCPIGTFSDEGFARQDDSCKPCPKGETTKTIGSIGISSCYSPTEYDHLMMLYNAITAGKNDPSKTDTVRDVCSMKELKVACDEDGHVISFSIPLSGITYDENVPWV